VLFRSPNTLRLNPHDKPTPQLAPQFDHPRPALHALPGRSLARSHHAHEDKKKDWSEASDHPGIMARS